MLQPNISKSLLDSVSRESLGRGDHGRDMNAYRHQTDQKLSKSFSSGSSSFGLLVKYLGLSPSSTSYLCNAGEYSGPVEILVDLSKLRFMQDADTRKRGMKLFMRSLEKGRQDILRAHDYFLLPFCNNNECSERQTFLCGGGKERCGKFAQTGTLAATSTPTQSLSVSPPLLFYPLIL